MPEKDNGLCDTGQPHIGRPADSLCLDQQIGIQKGRRIMAENEPVVRLFFARMKDAFLDLPEEEKIEFMRKDRENLDALGMKAVAMIDCRWSNDEWDYIGVEQWPSMEAIQARERFENEELNVCKYVESKTYLGTPQPFEDYGKT